MKSKWSIMKTDSNTKIFVDQRNSSDGKPKTPTDHFQSGLRGSRCKLGDFYRSYLISDLNRKHYERSSV